MKNQFVTYEIAKKLKELGFNEPCLSTYTYDGFKYDVLTHISERTNINNSHDEYTYSAPLWQQVIDWLREEHNLQVYVKSNTVNTKGNYIDWIYIVGDTMLDSRNGFDTYEEAREKAILTALKLI